VIKHSPAQPFVLKDLLTCLYFSQKNEKFENVGGVKLKHLLETQNTRKP